MQWLKWEFEMEEHYYENNNNNNNNNNIHLGTHKIEDKQINT